MVARVAGADPIIGVDVHPKRLALARELGATHCLNTHEDSVAKSIRAITGSGVAHVVETTGDTALNQAGLDLLNSRGKMALLTGESGPGSLTDGRRVFGVTQGDAVPQRFIPYLIKLHEEGRFHFDRLVRFYAFSDINQAMADASRGDVIKPVLRMGGRV